MKIIRYIIDIAVPALTAYLASSDTLIQLLIKHNILSQSFNVRTFQDVCLIINILFTTILLSARLIMHESKEESYKKQIAGLYNVIKQFLQSNLAQISGNSNISFDLRIFVPEQNIWRRIKTLLGSRKEKWFVIRNIEPFARKDITEHLKFRVDPEEQGLVGSAYSSKSIVYDDHLSSTNSTGYSLNQAQINRTSNLLWSICIPILNEKDEVVAIMAIDSGTSQLDIAGNKDEIRTLTNTLAVMMRDSVPELFKGEVSFRW